MNSEEKLPPAKTINDILYEDVFNKSPFGIYTLDAHGTITSFNPKMAELSGDVPENAIGLNALELKSYQNVGLDKLFVQGIDGEPFETEVEYYSHLANKKSIRHYRGIPIPDHGIEGQARLLLIVEDITHRKAIEDELRDEEARLRASIEGLSIGYIMTGPDNALLLINQAAESILTLATPSAYPVSNAIDVSHLRGNIDFAFIQQALSEKVDLAIELDRSRREKQNITIKDVPYKILHLNVHITPILGKVGEDALGSVILLEDITEQKVVERSRDEFFSIASHELRTPLTAIRGNTSLIKAYLKDTEVTPELDSVISDIHDASVRLIDIVNDFLDMSRIEQGKIQYKLEAFDIYELCKSITREYDVTGSRKKLLLEVKQPAAPLPKVYADKDRIRQIVGNLFGNAIKFTSEGSVTIELEKLENQIKVSVTDTGTGIPSESIPLLFRKFQQAESNILTRDASRGTGLGLYISRMMARGMGGDVMLDRSDVGKGTTFSVIIPIASEAQSAQIGGGE